MLSASDAIPTAFPKTAGHPVLRQVGWLGASGAVYPVKTPPRFSEPGGFEPLYISVGTWEDTDGVLTIRD